MQSLIQLNLRYHNTLFNRKQLLFTSFLLDFLFKKRYAKLMWFKLRLLVIILTLIFLGACSGVRVKKGDTLYSISKRHDVPMRAIIEENNLKPDRKSVV